MKLTEKKIQEYKKEVEETTRILFEEEKWLLDEISAHIDVKGGLMPYYMEADTVCMGFFITKDKEVYYFDYEIEDDWDDEQDKEQFVDGEGVFSIEKVENPQDLEKECEIVLFAIENM